MRESELLTQLLHTVIGYWRSQVLFTVHELGVFDFLSEGGRAAEEIVGHCGTAFAHTERLLNAAAALRLLKKEGERFDNTPVAEAFLVRSSPQYMGHWIRLMGRWYRTWSGLKQMVQTGEAVEDSQDHLGADPNYTRNFILAMHEYARGPGKEMVNHVDLSGRRLLLDLAGGPGTYALMLAQKYPDLRAVVFDLPAVVEITREVIESYGLSDRVSTRAGDYMISDFGAGYEVVLMSNMLTQENPESTKKLLRRVYDAMARGGLLIVQGMFLNAAKDGPAWPALQSLMLSLVYQNGRGYSHDETQALLVEAGFSSPRVKRMSLFNAESLVVAAKT